LHGKTNLPQLPTPRKACLIFLEMNVIINYTIEQIAKLTGGALMNYQIDAPAPVYLSLDSRKIIFPADTIFFAIKTTHQDGNSFIEGLYAKGVRSFVTENVYIDLKTLPLANVILVSNAVHALQSLASYHRSRFIKAGNGQELPVIGITGSNGKTVVKEWLNQLLAPDYVIARSPRSYNSQVGVPLSVLDINPSHTLAIFEAGISHTREMHQLEKMIRPTIGVLTNIGQAHDSGFRSHVQKISEKLKLFVRARHVIFCADDPGIKKRCYRFPGENKK